MGRITIQRFVAMIVIVVVVAPSSNGSSELDGNAQAGTAVPNPASQSSFEADGIRVSIQSLKWNENELNAVYRIEFTTKPRQWSIRRGYIPVDFMFWNDQGMLIKTDMTVIVYFSKDFISGDTDKNDAILKITPPPGARHISIQKGRTLTRRIPIP
jgi:hypothetical protein